MNVETFDYLVKNKSQLIELKKSTFKCSDPVICHSVEASKALSTSNIDDLENGIIKRSIIGNTYYWFDSHKDVHVGNTFSKSLKERSNKIFHLHDHLQQLTAQVGKFSNVYEKTVSWRDLGVNKDGETIILVGDSEIKSKYNQLIFDAYLANEVDQHSVGMVYVKMELAINSSEYKDEFEEWNKHISKIGNAEEAIKNGYFWAHSESKLKEMSAVLAGSNPITPTIQNIEPFKNTQTQEPSNDTQTGKSFFINLSK